MSGLDVVLPMHGELPWLEPALASLAAQTRPADHVWLVDDGVHDAAAVTRLARRLLGPGCTLLASEGRGISAALNTGVRHSDATWIARMDADDLCRPQRFARQLAWLEERDDLVGCGAQVRFVDETGQATTTSAYPQAPDDFAGAAMARTVFSHPSLVLRRSALRDCPYRGALDGAEDVDLVLRLLERGSLANMADCLLDYRVGSHQVNYRGRARQTALQELAFRLAHLRRAGGVDPLDGDPGLAGAFVDWRLGQAGYTQARQAMTAARYAWQFLAHGRYGAARHCLGDVIAGAPWHPTVVRWVLRVLRGGPGALARQPIEDRVLAGRLA